ncbi:MAG: MATE family efflux transporter, partial [Myxococcota bacterium]|nr:MATE family efflux transporter [Myxococcota bacterium]
MTNHEQQRTSRLDEFVARPRRAVWVMAAPMMAGFMVHAIYAIADAAFIGRLGADALAAVTYMGALVFFAIAIATGLSIGVTAAIAQAIGRRDKEGAEHLAGNSILLGLGVGLALCACGLLFGEKIIPVLGAQERAAKLAWEYLQIISFGMPIMLFSWVLRAILSGEGEARIPMVILAIATVLNLVLDPIFIFALELGVRGAALASVLSAGLSVIAYLYAIVWKGRTYLRLRLSTLLPRRQLLMPILAIGAPTAAGQVVLSVAAGLVNRLLAEYGQDAVAGYGAGSKVDMLVALPVIGLASAAVSIIGMFAGAGRVDLVRA